jgi:hypothetical protein
VELKRTEDGGHADLQAIRYAAMVHLMTFDVAVKAHASYLKRSADEARQAILSFLQWQKPEEDQFAQDVRVVLVASEFSKEITTTALWLNQRKIDVRCVRVKPYKVSEHVLVDIQEIVPLPEASSYQNQFRKKIEEERESRNARTRRSNFRFSMLNIPPGTLLTHATDPNEVCTVQDDRNVLFRNKTMSLTQSAGIVLSEHGLSDSIAGTDYWMLNGESLSDLRDKAEEAVVQ